MWKNSFRVTTQQEMFFGGEPTENKRAELIQRAREIAEAEGWLWIEPVSEWLEQPSSGKGLQWVVFSNARERGYNVCVRFSETGELVSEEFRMEVTDMTSEEAVSRAKVIAEENEWLWIEPVSAGKERTGALRLGSIEWVVISNVNARGCNAQVTFDEAGYLKSKGYAPR